jgi:hypothetical protein
MREVQEWARDMRQLVFKSVSGLSQSITSLDGLGIGFSGIDTSAKVLDEAKLTKALSERPNEVEAFPEIHPPAWRWPSVPWLTA